MIAEATLSIALCIAALVMTVLVVRRSSATLALPLAYMVNLLLIHVPGAYAFVISGGEYAGLAGYGSAIPEGILLTAVAAVCFVVGTSVVALTRREQSRDLEERLEFLGSNFMFFCLMSGAVLTFGVGPLRAVPTLGAALYFGSSVWMLAALVGLAGAVRNRKSAQFALWLAVLLGYPLLVLLLSGFMSYGAAAVIVVGSLAVVQTRTNLRSLMIIVALGYLGISVFVNYYGSRADLRSTLWSSAGFEQRIDAVADAFSGITLFSHNNPKHLKALTQRLNQNEFVGIAADRLDNGQVEYLRGQSLWEAAIAPIPRAIWPDKPVGGGSGKIIPNMTGLKLARNTSWGVGNVMEFYINFGLSSLIGGFLLLGFVIAWLDRRAALLLTSPRPSRSLLYFLPCLALIQPNGSLVELVGGAFAALLAAVALHIAWLVTLQRRANPYDSVANYAGREAR